MPNPGECSHIIDLISEEYVSPNVRNTHVLARESFTLAKNNVANQPAVVALLVKYVRHHRNEPDLPEHEALGLAEKALRNANTTLQRVYYDCITGTNGGVRRVLNTIAEAFEEQAVAEYVEYVLVTEVDDTDPAQIEEVLRQLVKRFGQAFPWLKSTAAMQGEWKSVITSVARALSRLRSRIGKPE